MVWWHTRAHRVGVVVDVKHLGVRYAGKKVSAAAAAAARQAAADISVPPPPVPKVTAFSVDVVDVAAYKAGIHRHVAVPSSTLAADERPRGDASSGESTACAAPLFEGADNGTSTTAGAATAMATTPSLSTSTTTPTAVGRPNKVVHEQARRSPFVLYQPLHPLQTNLGDSNFFAGATRAMIGSANMAPDVDAPPASLERQQEHTPMGDSATGARGVRVGGNGAGGAGGGDSSSSDEDEETMSVGDEEGGGYHSDDSDDDALPPPHAVVTDMRLLWTIEIRDLVFDMAAAFTQVIWNHRHEYTRHMYVESFLPWCCFACKQPLLSL